MMNYFQYPYQWGCNHVFFGGFMMIVFWAVIILIIYAVLKSARPNDSKPDSVEILKSRYAKGEITKKQFEEIMKDLESHHV